MSSVPKILWLLPVQVSASQCIASSSFPFLSQLSIDIEESFISFKSFCILYHVLLRGSREERVRLLFGSHLIDVSVTPQERTTLASRQLSVTVVDGKPGSGSAPVVAYPVAEPAADGSVNSSVSASSIPDGVVPVLASPVKPPPAEKSLASSGGSRQEVSTSASTAADSQSLPSSPAQPASGQKTSLPVPIASVAQATKAQDTSGSSPRSCPASSSQSSQSGGHFAAMATRQSQLSVLIRHKEREEDKATAMTQVCV